MDIDSSSSTVNPSIVTGEQQMKMLELASVIAEAEDPITTSIAGNGAANIATSFMDSRTPPPSFFSPCTTPPVQCTTVASSPRKSATVYRSIKQPVSALDQLNQGIFVLNPDKAPEYSFAQAYRIIALQKAILNKELEYERNRQMQTSRRMARIPNSIINSPCSSVSDEYHTSYLQGSAGEEDLYETMYYSMDDQSLYPQLPVNSCSRRRNRNGDNGGSSSSKRHRRHRHREGSSGRSTPNESSRSASPGTFEEGGVSSPSSKKDPNAYLLLTTKGITEEEQLSLKDYFPGAPGIHMTTGCPTALEHRQTVFEKVMNKKRSGQSIQGVRPGNPLQVTDLPAADLLSDAEFEICCALRLTPAQYFHSRKVLLDNFWDRGWYNKSAAQKMLRIDVNKTGKLWEFMVARGWMPYAPNEAVKPPPHDLAPHILKKHPELKPV